MCVCSVSYTACNAHAPYCHLWPVWLLYFSTLSHKRHHFPEKKLLHIKYVFRFSPQPLSEIFLILGSIQRDTGKNVFIQNTRYSCQILIKLEFTRHIFEKYSNIMKIRPVGVELFQADGGTDEQISRSQ